MEINVQQIHGAIANHLPDSWERYVIYFAISNNMFEFKYYVDEGKGFVDCYALAGYDDSAFYSLALEIKQMLSFERNKLPKRKQWSVFTMSVASTGKFNVEYFYDNISKTYITYRQEWEAKHVR